jgi:hypothetical protein
LLSSSAIKLLSAALLTLFLPSLAAAQSSGVFVQAGPLVNFAATPDFGRASASLIISGPGLSSSTDDEVFEESESGVTAGAALAVGVFVAPSVSLRLEASVQGGYSRDSVTTSASQQTRDESHETTKNTDVIVAAAWHQGTARKVSVNYLAGMVFRRYVVDSSNVFSFPELTTSVVNGRLVQNVTISSDESDYDVTAYGAGIMAGIDVVWRLSDSLAVVPQFRMVTATSELALRPAITLRWNP